MEEQEFKAILREAGIPENYVDELFSEHSKNFRIGFKCSSELLLFFAKNAVVKGCHAPW